MYNMYCTVLVYFLKHWQTDDIGGKKITQRSPEQREGTVQYFEILELKFEIILLSGLKISCFY